MSEHHRGDWGARDDAMWWPGAIAADQQNLQQHHQQLLQHQQQQLAAAAQAAQQQNQNHHDAVNSSASATHQLFSYKMASSFQNPATTVSMSNVAPSSPVGAAGIRGYDYRLGGGMTGGNPAMSAPAPAAQWWYPPASMDNNMHSTLQTLQNNMQQHQQNMQQSQSQQQNMPPVQTPPPAQSEAQVRQDEVQRVQEAHRQHQESAHRQEVHRQHQEAHRQHQEAHRQHQEAQRQHQEAQRQQVEAQQAAIQQHHQALADQVRHQQQLQQQRQQHLQHQVQQVQNNHHQQSNQHQSVLQQQQVTTVLAPISKRMPRGKGDSRPRGRMTAYAFFVQTCREEHKKKHPEENVVFAEFSKKCAERWKTMLDKEKKRFHEMAENDKKRYDAEMQNYTPPKGEKQRGKRRKQMKDPNAPKRSLSAFFWFSNDERGKVKAQNPEYGVGDIAKELGRRWADAEPETKAKFEALADKDKARYEKEMTAYKKKNNPALQQAPPVPDDVDEDDEEAEEDEDE